MAVLDILIEDLEKISELCKKYKKEISTEIKLIYDVKKNSLNAAYQYDLIHSKDPVKTPRAIAEEWFEEIKKSNNN